jgi:hypothetical protein
LLVRYTPSAAGGGGAEPAAVLRGDLGARSAFLIAGRG